VELFSYTIFSASVCVAATACCDRDRRYLTLSWLALQFLQSYPLFEGRDSSVGIATRYGLDGPGSNPSGGEGFRIRPDWPWGPPSLLYSRYRVFPGGKAAGAWR